MNNEERNKGENEQKEGNKKSSNEILYKNMELSNQDKNNILKNESDNNKNLLKSIHSVNILKKILSNLKPKQKLYMIKYNKDIQNLLEINIQDYKKMSGKYKINGINGNGKEYLLDVNILIFEGEYKNGRKNGKGKEYDEKGRLKFEGDYINGEKKGDGNVVIYDNGKINLKEYIKTRKK